MGDSTPSSLALDKIREQIAALDVAVDALVLLRDDKKIDRDFANFRIDRLSSRESDLRNLRRTIILTGQVTSPPKPEQVAELRARVVALRKMNVTAASIEGILKEAILVAEVVEGGSLRSAGREAPASPKPSEVVPLTLAFGAGTAAGLVLAALLRARD